MPGTPGTPITSIPATSAPNGDLPADAFPSLERLTVIDRVGSPACNRQDAAEEKRTETIRTAVNLLVTAMNAIDTDYMRRDGTTQADANAGFEANIPMNGHIFTGLGNGSVSTDSCAFGQLATAITNLLAASNTWTSTNVFSGIISVPTQAVGDNSGKAASTAFVQAATTTVVEFNASGTYTNSTGHDVLVLLSAVGGGGGGADDTNHATGGGAGGAIVNLPIALQNGDTIGFVLGSGGAGGVSGPSGNGTPTTVTITRAVGPTVLTLTLNGGTGGINAATVPGGTVTFQQLDTNLGPLPAGHAVPFPAGITGSIGTIAGTGPNRITSGGASPFSGGGTGSSSSGPIAPVNGLQGAGGGGGDGGSNGGDGYACLVITARP